MTAGHSSGLELGGGEDIFFNHYPGDIKFFRYRTSHQDSLDHNANISRHQLKARAILVLTRVFGISRPGKWLLLTRFWRFMQQEANNFE